MAATNINRVVLTGNLTFDPELRSTPSGMSVCRLRLAVNGRRKDPNSQQWVDKPNYFDVTVWGKSADNAGEHLEKGQAVVVDGRLEWREWTDNDDNKRQSVEIMADSIQYGAKSNGSASEES